MGLFKKHSKDKQTLEDQIELSKDIETEDKALLKSVFEFGDTITREVMVPRIDMITLDSDDTLDGAMKLFCRSGFSRMPVLGESADEVIGIAYFKDIVDELYTKGTAKNASISSYIRPALFVPESKPVDDLFRMMQEERQHIVMVIDEYAGVAGLVTLEDTIEEIVGELYDEHDSNEDDGHQIERDSNKVVISGVFPSRFSISDINDLFEVEIEHDDVDTILGLLTREIGKVAIKGSTANVAGLELEAMSTSGRRKRVATVKVCRPGGISATSGNTSDSENS
jgi:CBS domain containing-hemolysin-like protein